jgi:hypothetical protein
MTILKTNILPVTLYEVEFVLRLNQEFTTITRGKKFTERKSDTRQREKSRRVGKTAL